jgi:hypothetical protein
MNFYKALQHAFIGYGIRRKPWSDNVILYYDHEKEDLRYTNSHSPSTISDIDFHATDWETI